MGKDQAWGDAPLCPPTRIAACLKFLLVCGLRTDEVAEITLNSNLLPRVPKINNQHGQQYYLYDQLSSFPMEFHGNEYPKLSKMFFHVYRLQLQRWQSHQRNPPTFNFRKTPTRRQRHQYMTSMCWIWKVTRCRCPSILVMSHLL